MEIKELIAQLSQTLNMPGLQLSEQGACRVQIENRLIVDIEVGDDGTSVHFHSVVGKIAQEHTGLFCKFLLEANLFGRGTAGASLGIDSHENEILLFIRLDCRSMEFAEFAGRLELFLRTAD